MPQITEFNEAELENVEETIGERLVGLTEMIPESAYTASSHAVSAGKAVYQFVRSSIWIISTSIVVLTLPVALEAERVNMEMQRDQEQRQALFGTGPQQPGMA